MGEIPGQNTFGYSEMYEWSEKPEVTFGKFVQFSNIKDKYHCIVPATNVDAIIGVSTINAQIVSDDPNEWFLKYAFNEYGDLYFKNENIAVGKKEYDDVNELSFIRTQSQSIYVPVLNDEYDKSKQYIKRTARQEWVRVNLIGKCIVEDDGNCVPGQYCTLYTGDDTSKFGTAIPANDKTTHKWYVMNRVSPKTILILYK